MKTKAILFGALAFVALSCSKEVPVDNSDQVQNRYKQEVFSEVQVSTVTYNSDLGLELDVYVPKNDDWTNRRLVILGHGGTFIAGSKENPLMVDMATRLAKHGYTVASYNYRLAGDFNTMLDSLPSLGVVARALTDANDALEFLVASHANGNPYGIDPDKIAIGGNSAGAVLAVHLAHFDENDAVSAGLQQQIDMYGGHSEMWNPTAPGRIKAVVSLAGGIHKTHWLNAYGPELIMAHGSWDPVVPYGCARVINNTATATQLCGASALGTQAQAIGLDHETKVWAEMLHCPWNSDATVWQETFDFIVPRLDAAME